MGAFLFGAEGWGKDGFSFFFAEDTTALVDFHQFAGNQERSIFVQEKMWPLVEEWFAAQGGDTSYLEIGRIFIYPEAGLAYYASLLETHTRLPDDLAETLRHLAAQQGIEPPEVMRAESTVDIANQVAAYVKSSATYTTSPPHQPIERDFAEYFLTEGKQGYCVHFATATVAMLRALGIPARYAEGFTVSAANFGSGNTATVPMSRAHAWAEVWDVNLGWVPIESTPSGAAALGSPSGEGAAAEGTDPPEPRPEPVDDILPLPDRNIEPPAPANPKPEEAPAPGTEASPFAPMGGGMVLAVLLALGLLVLMGLLVVQGHRLRPWVRRRRLSRLRRLENGNTAVLATYVYLQRLAAYGYRPAPQMTALANKAKFSPHSITQAEREAALQEAYRAARATEAALSGRRLLGFKLRLL